MTMQAEMPALENLFRKYLNLVFRVCRRYMRNDADAEDLTQEVFIRVHHRLPTFRGDCRISTWIYRIAVNACLDALRRKARESAFAALEGEAMPDPNAAEFSSGRGQIR